MSLLSLTSDELDEWCSIHYRIDALIKKAEKDGVSIVGGNQPDPDLPRFALASRNRSSVMAWRTMVMQASDAGDLDIFKIYDRFIQSPEVDHNDIKQTVLTLRRAGINPTAQVITAMHIRWHGEVQKLIPKSMRGMLDWSDTAMLAVITLYVAGSDSMRKIIASDTPAVFRMMKERNLTTYEELTHVLEPSDGGSLALTAGSL